MCIIGDGRIQGNGHVVGGSDITSMEMEVEVWVNVYNSVVIHRNNVYGRGLDIMVVEVEKYS